MCITEIFLTSHAKNHTHTYTHKTGKVQKDQKEEPFTVSVKFPFSTAPVGTG